jgi:ATP-dependent RNA helicase DDX56/DBP9
MSRATKRAHFEEEAEDDDEKMVDEVAESEEDGEEEEGEEEEGEEEEGEEAGEGAGDMAAAGTASTTVAAAPAAASFEALGLDLRLLKAVRKLGLARPTAVQARVVPLVLQGKDVVARAPTGTGKTYAYSIPLLQKVLARQDGLAGEGAAGEEGTAGVGGVILVPTRELCQQVLRLGVGVGLELGLALPAGAWRA